MLNIFSCVYLPSINKMSTHVFHLFSNCIVFNSVDCHFIFWDRVSHWISRPIILAEWLASNPQKSPCLWLFQVWDYRCVAQRPAFVWALGIQTQVLAMQAHYTQNHAYSPYNSLHVFSAGLQIFSLKILSPRLCYLFIFLANTFSKQKFLV